MFKNIFEVKKMGQEVTEVGEQVDVDPQTRMLSFTSAWTRAESVRLFFTPPLNCVSELTNMLRVTDQRFR